MREGVSSTLQSSNFSKTVSTISSAVWPCLSPSESWRVCHPSKLWLLWNHVLPVLLGGSFWGSQLKNPEIAMLERPGMGSRVDSPSWASRQQPASPASHPIQSSLQIADSDCMRGAKRELPSQNLLKCLTLKSMSKNKNRQTELFHTTTSWSNLLHSNNNENWQGLISRTYKTPTNQ